MNNFQKETLYDARKKNTLIAYLLGGLLGGFGIHHFYLERYQHGVAYIIMTVLTLVFAPFSLVLCIMFLVDLCLTWKYVKEYNTNVRNQIEMMEE